MTKLTLLLLGLGLAPAALVLACATDNGDSVHGEQFGPPPGRGDASVDGAPVVADDGGPMPLADAASDAWADADAAVVPTCSSGTIAVLAGGDTTLSGAAQIAGGAWSGGAIAGGAAKSPPSLVAFGTGFLGLTRGSADALQSVTYGASWGAVSAVAGATTLGTPALTVVGAKAQAVYPEPGSPPNKFFRTESAATTWSAADPVTPPGGVQSFGLSAGTVAAAGTNLAFAQAGDNEGLYFQEWSGTWTTGTAIAGAGTLKTAAPALVAVDGKFDLVLLYADNSVNNVIRFVTREKVGKVWTGVADTNSLALTGEQFSVASISATKLVVTFRGNNQRPYYMTGTIGASAIAWSAPAALLADTSTVDTSPAVAKGVCGDDAIAVFASAGQVKATRYSSGAWSVPEPVSGATGTRVAVSTR